MAHVFVINSEISACFVYRNSMLMNIALTDQFFVVVVVVLGHVIFFQRRLSSFPIVTFVLSLFLILFRSFHYCSSLW